MSERGDQRSTIVLVGTGHWSNPSLDFKTTQFDDMLAAGRQQEIADCLRRLARFAPTKVAIEVMANATDELNQDYRRYRGGSLALTANERHQLGFRLAAMMGHDRIYGIDWHDLERPIGWEGAISFARKHGQHFPISFFTQTWREREQERAAERAKIGKSTVRELLLEASDPARLADNHRVYMDLVQVGKGDNYIGAEVILRWYERNMKIFVNLSRIATSSDDRVLVVIGAGHLPLLSHFIESSGRFQLVPASTFLS